MNNEITYKVQTCNSNPEVIIVKDGVAKGIVHEITGYVLDHNSKLELANKLAETLNKNIHRMNPLELKNSAQRIYDKENWSGISGHERIMLIAMRLNYMELTGEVLKLEYNCPA